VKLVINGGIWNIVAHIAFKFYPGASETFSTASTTKLSSRRGEPTRSRKAVVPRRSAAALG
jgi:hypothetical protein